MPVFQFRVGQDGLNHIQGEIKTILLFGINIEAHVGRCRLSGELECPGHELIHHPLFMPVLIACQQRRQLHRDTRIRPHIAFAALADAVNGIRVRLVITLSIGIGARRFAQHVIGIGIAPLFLGLAAVLCLFNGTTQYKLAPHFLHGLARHGAHNRFAQALYQLAQGIPHTLALGILQQVAGHQQGQGGRVDHSGFGFAHVGAPVARGDLVFDQVLDGEVVGYPQQSLRQAHKSHPFFGGQPIFGEKLFHDGRACAVANITHQLCRPGRNSLSGFIRQLGLSNQPVNHFMFICQVVCTDRLANVVKFRCHRLLKTHGVPS